MRAAAAPADVRRCCACWLCCMLGRWLPGLQCLLTCAAAAPAAQMANAHELVQDGHTRVGEMQLRQHLGEAAALLAAQDLAGTATQVRRGSGGAAGLLLCAATGCLPAGIDGRAGCAGRQHT